MFAYKISTKQNIKKIFGIIFVKHLHIIFYILRTRGLDASNPKPLNADLDNPILKINILKY